MAKRICKNCGEEFMAKGARTIFCQKPTCQEARIERRKKYELAYQRAHPKTYKRKRTYKKIPKMRTYKTSSNWSMHHKGKCEVCRKLRLLNRFGLCRRCFTNQSNRIASDSWL